ncbi:unnamed protein product [Absidia cylindrospora]
MTNHHYPEQQQQQQQDPDLMAISRLVAGESRPSPRPPSYKLDTHVDLDALERDLQQSIQSHQKGSKWQHPFHGTALVFWLVLFVLIGMVSFFLPQQQPSSVALWLPLLVYLFALFLFHVTFRKKRAQSLQDRQAQLAAIHQRRQRVLTQVSEYPADLFFLYATSDHYTHPVTTLLPPPPSYQRD